ncbi:MAG: ATP-dependent Clp protease adaptor ClpS [Anaerolineae bacterium]
MFESNWQLNTGQETEREQDLHLESMLEPLYRVIIHNDDVTPYDFVIIVLQRFFQLDPLEAEHVTFIAHSGGQAHVATLPLPEAQKRVGQAHFAASLEGYPLMFTIEPE